VAKKVEAVDGKVKVDKVTTDGYEVVEVPTPALITVSNELGEVRLLRSRVLWPPRKKEPIIWKPADIGVDPAKIGAAGRRTKTRKLFQPVRDSKCEIIKGENDEDAALIWQRNSWRSNLSDAFLKAE